jgi:hypothetical protein
MRLGWLLVWMAGCQAPAGGMLLTVEGAVSPDQLRLTASFDGRQVVRLIPEAASLGPMALPTDLFATFSDHSTMVALGVEALAGGKTVASVALPPISVDPKQLVRTTAQLVAVTPLPDPPKGDAPGGGAPMTPNKPTYPQIVLADSPIAYYRLDDTLGTMAFDSSGHGLHGTYGTAIVRGAPGLVVGGNRAAQFPGGDWSVDRFVAVPPSTLLEPRTLSIELWFRTTVFNDPVLLAYGEPLDHSAPPPWGAFIAQNAIGTFLWTHLETAYRREFATVTRPAVGLTYHFVLTWDGQSVRMYVNGTLESQRSLPGTLVVQPARSGLGIGAFPDGLAGDIAFAGTIDEVAIYGAALTPQQVRAHYVAGTTP